MFLFWFLFLYFVYYYDIILKTAVLMFTFLQCDFYKFYPEDMVQ